MRTPSRVNKRDLPFLGTCTRRPDNGVAVVVRGGGCSRNWLHRKVTLQQSVVGGCVARLLRQYVFFRRLVSGVGAVPHAPFSGDIKLHYSLCVCVCVC